MNYFDASASVKPMLHTWSLAVEEQFYLFFPPAAVGVYAILRQKSIWVWVGLAILSLALAQYRVETHGPSVFFLLPYRAWELLFGSISAMATLRWQAIRNNTQFASMASAVGVLLIVASMLLLDEYTPMPGFWSLGATFGAALILLFANGQNIAGRLLGAAPLVGVGLISYSAYLWHQPILAYWRIFHVVESSPAVNLLLVAVTLILSWLTWKYVEAPFRKKGLIGRSRIFWFALIGSVACVGLAGALLMRERYMPPDSASVAAIYAVRSEKAGDLRCWEKLRAVKNISAACRIGKGGALQFAVFGDSHAGALVSGLDALGRRAHIMGLNLTLNGCAPFLPPAKGFDDLTTEWCPALRRQFFERLDSLPKVIVINQRWPVNLLKLRYDNREGGVERGKLVTYLSAGDHGDTSAAIARDLRVAIDMMLAHGKTVILVYPVPEAGWDVPDILALKMAQQGKLAPQDGSTSFVVFKERMAGSYAMLDSIGEKKGLIRVYPAQLLCDRDIPGRCLVHTNGKPLYMDNNHLSNVGSRMVADEIGRLEGILQLSK